jgi:uridine kinase
VLEQLVSRIDELGPRRLRVAVDGFTAAGKTSLGHELAGALAARGRSVFRASLDDFKRPWSEAGQYDRTSGEGYYRNAFDLDAIRRLLLDPAAPDGDGMVALCAVDPITQIDHSTVTVSMPADGVLLVDGVFALRPELDDVWDLRIWVDVDPELSVQRGTARDAEMEGGADAAEQLHRERYLASELLYVKEADPRARADAVVDNSDFADPRLAD